MPKPVLEADVRPTTTVTKRVGTFSDGHTEAAGLGHVELDFEFRKAAEFTATFDNANKKLNGLSTGDYINYSVQYAGATHTLFFGIIQRVKFDSVSMTCNVEALDTGTIGKSRDLNRELYQKFNPNVQTDIVKVGGKFESAIPAEAKLDAPLTVKSRRVEGNHLRTDLDNDANHQWDPVYATPDISDGGQNRGGAGPFSSQPNCDLYEVRNGAERHATQVFTVPNTGTITNLIIPLTIVRHLHENAANNLHADYDTIYAADGGSGAWNLPGVIGNCMYCFQATDTRTEAASASMLGPLETLEISLVKAVKCTESGIGATTHTPADVSVRSGDYIPTSLNAGAEWITATGHNWGTKLAAYDTFPLTDPCLHRDGTHATVDVSPTDVIGAPNGPAGETIKHTYKWRTMYDDNGLDAYTMFEWNFAHNPISVTAGDQIAIVVAMKGHIVNGAPGSPEAFLPLHEIPNPNDDTIYERRLTPCAYWGVGINKYQAQATYGRYDEGSYMMAALSTSSNTAKGHHGSASFSLLAHEPGYDSQYAQYGIWEYMANVNPQVMQMEAWNSANAGNTLNMFNFPLYDNRWNTHAMYFTVVMDGYSPLTRIRHYELDELSRKVLFGENASIFVPIDTDYLASNLIKLDYYSNPISGGLLNPGAASSVSDMVKKLATFIPQWTSVICDATGDYVDDAQNVGYRDPATWEFHYLSCVQSNVWDSLQEVALRNDAQVWTYHDGANATLIFEKLTPLSDFTYTAPGSHQYTFSTRTEDDNWMKHIIKLEIKRDVNNMYSRFKVVGRTDPKTQYGYNAFTKEYMEVRTSEPSPITYYLDAPEVEALLGYRREKVMTNNRNVTTYQSAADVAKALKTIYGVDQWSGEITLAGLHPLMNSPTLGLIFDRNAVVRIIDDHNPILSSSSGTTNVFRVTGATYNATQHTTKIRLTNLLESKPELQARRLLEDIRKSESLENTGRDISAFAKQTTPTMTPFVSESSVGLFDSSGAELTVPGYSRVKCSIVDDAELNSFQVIAQFGAGNGTIQSQSLPIRYVQVFGNGGISPSNLIELEDEVLKWEFDSFTVTIDILRS